MASKSLKIAIVSDSIFPYNKGGKETRIYNLSRELAKLGHDVHVYTMKWWDGENEIESNGVHYHAISRLHPLYSGDRRSIKQGIFFALSCYNLLRYDFDVLDADHMPFLQLFPLKFVSQIKRRPMFATWHEVWGTGYWREYLGLPGYLASFIERMSVKLPNHIVAVSSHTGTQLGSVLGYRGKLDIIPNGINSEAISRATPINLKSDLIYVGRLLSHKNVDLLIGAVGLLVEEYPQIQCLIIGDGPEREALERLRSELRLVKNITFAGIVKENNDVYAAMKSSRVLVLPSVREGFGVSVLEAFAAGLSVVTTNHPDNAARLLISPENGICVDATSSEIAAGIKELFENQDRDGRFDHTKSYAPYQWKALAVKLSGIYSQ